MSSIEITNDHRRVYDLLVNKHGRTGLSRDELARLSGLGDRKMRSILEDLRTIAAEKPHPKLGPLVLGYDPELNVYTYGKTARQRARIMGYYAARLQPIAKALAAQAKAAEWHGQREEPVQDALFQAERTLGRGAWS